MRVNDINKNIEYHAFGLRGGAACNISPINVKNNESGDILEIKGKSDIKTEVDDLEGPIQEPLSDYEKELFKRFQNFSAESINDLNTCVDVTAESINEDGLTTKHSAFMKIAKTPFFLIAQRISTDDEEEKQLKEKLNSSISKDFKQPCNPIEEAFNQYMEVVPYINQENSPSFVMPMFDDLKKLDCETISSKDILDVVKTHVNRQKDEQRPYEEPSTISKVWNFFFG